MTAESNEQEQDRFVEQAAPVAQEKAEQEPAEPDRPPGAGQPEPVITKRVVEYVVKSLVRSPDSVVVEAERDAEKWVLKVNVPQDDRGRVIGRNGRVIKALRAVTAAVGLKEGLQAAVEVINE